VSTHFGPSEVERKRAEAASAERLNDAGAPPTEFSDVRSLAKIALEKQGRLLRDLDARMDQSAAEQRLRDPNDPYTLLRLNRQVAKESEIDPKIPLISPIFRMRPTECLLAEE
jgi:hypothetical protein